MIFSWLWIMTWKSAALTCDRLSATGGASVRCGPTTAAASIAVDAVAVFTSRGGAGTGGRGAGMDSSDDPNTSSSYV